MSAPNQTNGADASKTIEQYQDGANAAQTTVSVFKSLDEIVGSPVSKFFTSRKTKQDMAIYLSEWIDYLYDPKRDLYYTPILNAQKFRNHMDRYDGCFRPVGQCRSTAPWAQLLQALAITPKNNVLSRRLMDSASPGRTTIPEISLEIDGEIICHIVNLFGRCSEPTQCLTQHENGKCVTTLGRFQWCTGQNGIRVSYVPSSEDLVNSVHRPFPYQMPLEKGTTIPTYDLNMNIGISDPKLAWPERTLPLGKRLEALESNKLSLHVDERDFRSKPFLAMITRLWLPEFNRITKRALTDGCSNTDFFKAVVETLRRYVDQLWDPRALDQYIRWLEESVFLLGEREYLFYRPAPMNMGPSPPTGGPRFSDEPLKGCVEEVLKAYELESPGSWKHSLSEIGDKVIKLILSGMVVFIDHLFDFMTLDQSSPVWKAVALKLEHCDL